MRRSTATLAAWMVLGGFAALAAACSGSSKTARTHAPNEHVFPEDGSCMSYDEAQKQLAALVTANQKAVRDAAAQEGYAPVELKGSLEGSSGILQPLWSVKDGQGPTGKTLFGPMAGGGCGEAPVADAVFVTGKQGDIYAINVETSALTQNVYEVCGCEADLPNHGCGAPPPPRQWLYELPKGARFAGTVKVATPRTSGRWEAVGREDPPCPPVQPPP
ncbi:MAG: hypothetical protein U0441_06830 [Polyangiaceae bacterium]